MFKNKILTTTLAAIGVALLVSSLMMQNTSAAVSPTTQLISATNPTKQIIFYNKIKDLSGNELSAQEVADKFDVSVMSRTLLLDYMPSVKAAGFDGPVLQYLILDRLAGISKIGNESVRLHETRRDSNGELRPLRACNAAERNYQGYSNNPNLDRGDFCRIHDSIYYRRPFDHDLNQNTPEVVATEGWFMHTADGIRRLAKRDGGAGPRVGNDDDNNDHYTWGYRPNPANRHLREFVIARILRELNGDGSSRERTFTDGIYLDNVGLSQENPLREAGDDGSREFGEGAAGHRAYADAVFDWVKQISAAMPLRSDGNKTPLWANMIGGNDSVSSTGETQWDRFLPYLDGAVHESFATYWGDRPRTPKELSRQFTIADNWLRDGRHHFIAISKNNDNTQDKRTQWARFSLAAYLMITDGVNASYKFMPNGSYGKLYDIPELYYNLGSPLAARQVTARDEDNTPIKYRREFQCGTVEVDAEAATGKITRRSGCQPQPLLSVTSLTLINADTDQPIGTLQDNAVIDFSQLPTRNLSVVANTSPTTVGSVRFAYDGVVNYQTENRIPYAIGGDDKDGTDILPWTPTLGAHTLTATPYTGADAAGQSGTPLTVRFTVREGGPIVGNTYQFLAEHSGKSLEVAGISASDGAVVQQWRAHGNANQRWRIELVEDGYYRLIAEHSGKALDVRQSGTTSGTIVQQWNWHGGTNQQWRIEPLGNNLYQLVPRHAPNMVLTVPNGSLEDGADIRIEPDANSAAQRWQLQLLP